MCGCVQGGCVWVCAGRRMCVGVYREEDVCGCVQRGVWCVCVCVCVGMCREEDVCGHVQGGGCVWVCAGRRMCVGVCREVDVCGHNYVRREMCVGKGVDLSCISKQNCKFESRAHLVWGGQFQIVFVLLHPLQFLSLQNCSYYWYVSVHVNSRSLHLDHLTLVPRLSC